jgi:hypothetical protein
MYNILYVHFIIINKMEKNPKVWIRIPLIHY